ncbi:MAG TPA: recombination protein RecR [Bacteroidales bacterium]|nr:recombination protein RecR [Bacteroidales bacterium]
MFADSYSSKLLENAAAEIAKLPGIGNKTALRLALHLLKKSEDEVRALSNALTKMREEIRYCSSCNNISDNDICEICANTARNQAIICVVESIKDVMAIEKTGQFKGLYHVLGGIISPLDGVGPDDLKLQNLQSKVVAGSVNELILTLSTTMEGDTTNFYLYRKFSPFNITITTPARGLAIGDEIEYADEITLGRSIANRMPFKL